ETVLDHGGITSAVLGGGFSSLYPRQHQKQAEKIIATGGALVSEFNPFTQSLPEFFPRRNRIISALSRGVLVVEAAIKSGAMVTAKYAGEQNRDIFAVAGPIFSEQSSGCHQLIQQGAKLVTKVEDILEEWQYPVIQSTDKQVLNDPVEQSIFKLCQNPNPITPDEIVEQTGLKPAVVNALLTKLELGGRVKELPGKRYFA
ncbi:MAG: DNA-processing protein DprA, partial [bacterium]|nr:DNA-processing protein DprA [bacterium]